MAVRLREVADRAGVSIRTVSYALNSPQRVAPDTLARVLAVVEDLAYSPNVVARGLKTGRTGLVGLIVPHLDGPYFAEVTRELVTELRAHGLTLVVDQTDGRPDRERELLLGGSRGAVFDALIVSPLALTAEDLARRSPDTPVVLLGERLIDSAHDHVLVDNTAGAYDATRHLVERGYRRIAFVGHLHAPPSETSSLRLAGYRRALEEAGLPRDEDTPVLSDFGRAMGVMAMDRLLDRAEPPDAVFCVSDLLALGAVRAAHLRGVALPDALGVVGFDDVEDGRYATPSLTTVGPDKRALARETVALLTARLAGLDSPPQSVVVGHELIVRESTR